MRAVRTFWRSRSATGQACVNNVALGSLHVEVPRLVVLVLYLFRVPDDDPAGGHAAPHEGLVTVIPIRDQQFASSIADDQRREGLDRNRRRREMAHGVLPRFNGLAKRHVLLGTTAASETSERDRDRAAPAAWLEMKAARELGISTRP